MSEEIPKSLYWYKALQTVLQKPPEPDAMFWTSKQRRKLLTALEKVMDLYITVDDEKPAAPIPGAETKVGEHGR